MKYPNPAIPSQFIDIAPETILTMCTSSFMLEGGDDYHMMKDLPTIVAPEQGFEIQAIVMNFIQTDKVLSPVVDGRMTKL